MMETTTTAITPYCLALATRQLEWPDEFVQRKLVRATRSFFKEHEELDLWIDAPPEPQDLYEEIMVSFLTCAIRPEMPRAAQRAILEHRIAFLGELSISNATQADRSQRGRNYILDQIDIFSGFRALVACGEEYQLGEEMPWWRPGDFFSNESLVAHIQREVLAANLSRRELQAKLTARLEGEGFVQISHQQYLDRARQPLIFELLAHSRALREAQAVLLIYTTPKKNIGLIAAQLESVLRDLQMRCMTELQRQSCALPMVSLFSLPREVNNIQTFFLSRPETLEIDEDLGVVSGPLEKARVRVIEERDTGQQTLFFDTDLVRRRSHRPDTFIAVQLKERQGDVLTALMQAIEQFGVNRNVLSHLPRVIAGMFSAAQRDRKHQFSSPGTFWDTDSGYRLCRIIGFDPDNKRHRKRVQQARELLEAFILHREVKGRDNQGRKVNIKWSGPIIEARAAKLEIELEDREGLSDYHNFRSWTIAEALWRMVLLDEEGGTPAFALLDSRAFELDASSSTPFNIYWTLVNRAYMDRVGMGGEFEINLWTVYTWSGLESINPRANRIRKQFREALDEMVAHGLLQSWDCKAIDKAAGTEELKAAKLKVIFGEEQLRSLPQQGTSDALDGQGQAALLQSSIA